MKSCKKGYYYCNTEQKCKPIPDGYTVKDDGFLVKEDRQIKKIVKQLRKSVKSHAKQADTLEKKISESKKDHEPEMIRNQLKTAGRASKRIEKHSRKKDNFKAWVQSKITKASDYLDTAADYLDSKEVDEAANPAQQAAIAIDMKKKGKKPKNMTEEGLRAWFGKSSGTTKSGRKVKGWVQVGGKYDGKPCARQPGQKTTPKCVSSAKRRSMSDKERDSAARRKRAADPNQPQKSGAAAPTMVSTDPKKKMKESYGGKGVSRQARLQSTHPPTAQAAVKNIPSETDRGSGNKAKRRAGLPVEKKSPTYKAYVMNKEEFTTLPLRLEIPKSSLDFKQGLMFRESLDTDSGMLFVFDNIAQQSFHMTETRIPLDIAFIREDGIIESIKQLEPNNPVPVHSEGAIELAIEVNRGWFAENNVEVGDQLDVEYIIPNQREKYRSETNTIYDIINEVKDKKGKGSGTKDACYHKVKSRYSVWPSAYASGALVKCRKVGAANWGNKSEAYEVTNADKKGNTPAYQGLMSGKKNKLTGKPLYKAAPHMKEGVVEIQNSDGQTIAGVVDIVGPANMKPVTNENGIWQGTEQISEMIGMKDYLLQRNKAYDKKMDSLLYNKKSDKKKPDNLTKEEVKRDEYGDMVSGPKISKKQKAKNLASNTPDEQHTTTTSEAMNPAQQAAIAISKKQRIMDLMVAKKKKKSMKEENLDEKCWKGYEKKGMKTMFGKRYPNCVKKKVGESVSDWRSEIGYEGKDEVKKLSEDDMKGMSVKSGHKRPTKSGAGMTKKGVEAYRRRNPGSKLQTAVTTKPSKLKKGSKAANRRKSYCARSAGQMKKFPKAAKDPNSRLRQARRRWNC